MPTPKPGQIRCPTCLRSTPPAAYCTQCGSPIPPSARIRPRGLDRDELEERVRRRPGEAAFRRGAPVEDAAPRGGYVPFEPEPEDALASRQEEERPPQRPDHVPSESDETRRVGARDEERGYVPPPSYAPPPATGPDDEPDYAQPPYSDEDAPYPADDAYDAYDDSAYARPEDGYAYPYPHLQATERRSRGGGALPIVGFVVLSVLALAVGAVLAGLLGGEDGVAQTTPSPAAQASEEPSAEPSPEATPEPTGTAPEETTDPTGGPVTFPDGASYELDVCATNEYTRQLDGCLEDASTFEPSDPVPVLVVFRGANGDDNLVLELLSDGSVIDQQEKVLGSVVSCGNACDGLIFGATYANLLPGEYEVVLRRNGEFADGAGFLVEG